MIDRPTVAILTLHTTEGRDVQVYANEADANRALVEYVRSWWDETVPDDAEMVRRYFEREPFEWYTIVTHAVRTV